MSKMNKYVLTFQRYTGQDAQYVESHFEEVLDEVIKGVKDLYKPGTQVPALINSLKLDT